MLCTKFFAICETSSVFPNSCDLDLVAYASYERSRIRTLSPNFGPSHSWGQHVSGWFSVDHVVFHMFCASWPELEAVEEHGVKMNGTLVVVRWPYLCHRTHLHIENLASTLTNNRSPPPLSKQKWNLWMQKMISNVDADFVLFKNLCPKTIEGNEKGAWWVGFFHSH
jgi:hypothetical protein